jgi:hypothetical protein
MTFLYIKYECPLNITLIDTNKTIIGSIKSNIEETMSDLEKF